jgi:hypothetical protein
VRHPVKCFKPSVTFVIKLRQKILLYATLWATLLAVRLANNDFVRTSLLPGINTDEKKSFMTWTTGGRRLRRRQQPRRQEQPVAELPPGDDAIIRLRHTAAN